MLTVLQRDFPLVPRPWAAIGAALGLGEAEVLDRVARLKARGLIREISAIFDARRLGYTTTLVALRVDPARLDAVADAISRHPGVSHNYRRDHALNLWFTLALPPGADLAGETRRLTARPGVQAVRLLPALKRYKLAVQFDLEGHDAEPQGSARRGQGAGPAQSAIGNRQSAIGASPHRLTERDKRLVRLTQQDLPLVAAPFAALAARAGLPAEELLGWLREMRARGCLRRLAATLRHRAVGFRANALTAWVVPPARIDEAGALCASHPQVSHCYRRAVFADWPYNLLAMVHARSRRESGALIRRMARQLRRLGVKSHAVLYSLKEHKKERVRYFD